MHLKHPNYTRRLWMLIVPLMLILTACGSANADVTPTLSVDEIFTSAAQTFAAQQATQLALTPPTGTPSPTLSPTLPLPSPFATISFSTPTLSVAGGSSCDNSAFVSDVTIPDDTKVETGKAFVKTWLLQNNGTCAWTTKYKLSFDSGDEMGGADAFLPYGVPVGQQLTISVKFKAPTQPGTYTSTWRLHNDQDFAFGDKPYVRVKVGSLTPADTPTVSPTP